MPNTIVMKSPQKPTLTAHQLADLRRGPRANIVAGPENDRYIALEAVSANLLVHFSPIAQKKLISEGASILTIPNGSKKAMLWIYKCMQAGNKDPIGLEAFEELDINALVLIYQHSNFLSFDSLQKRTYNKLKSKLYHSPPTVDDIKLLQTAIPTLYDFVVYRIARDMVNPWTRSYTAYMELASTNKAFEISINNAIQKLLIARVEASEKYYGQTKNYNVLWAIHYIDRVIAGNVLRKKSIRQLASKSLSDSNVPKGPFSISKQAVVTKKRPPTCYTCGAKGHIARNCTTEEATTVASNTAVRIVNGKVTRRGKKTSAKKAGAKFTCFNCGEEGHFARTCTVESVHYPY